MHKILTFPTWLVFLILIIPAFFPTTTLIGLIVTLFWALLIAFCVYFLGKSLYKKLPIGHDLKINHFNFNLIFPLIYFIIVFIFFDVGYEINQSYEDYGWQTWVILPFHIFAIYCMFYTIWFIAKCIATIENNKVVGFDNYFGYIFRLWFFPFGIWWIYPNIRKIFLDDKKSLPTT